MIINTTKLTDTELATLCGMSPQNLRATYKKSSDPVKQRVYQFLRIGAQAWKEKESVKQKNMEFLKFVQNMDPIEIDEPKRRGREIENIN